MNNQRRISRKLYVDISLPPMRPLSDMQTCSNTVNEFLDEIEIR